MHYLIVSLVGLCVGFVAAAYLFRRHYKNYHVQIEQRKEALRTIMYRTHHMGVNPVCKRIRGITTIGILVTKRLPACAESEEVISFFHLIETEAQDLENQTVTHVKEFEHLQ